MGDRYTRSIQAAYPTFEFARVDSESSHGSGKDSGDSIGASRSKLLVAAEENGRDNAHVWNAARHSTSGCTSAERREVENGGWSSIQSRGSDNVTANFGFVGSSFRSEDSEVLALWEEKSEAVSTDLSWHKPLESQSSWSVSNAMKKIESLSHAWAKSSPGHPNAGAILDNPRSSLEYLKKPGGRSPWRDFKIVSSPVKATETVLHNSPKARYNSVSSCRRLDSNECESHLGPISEPCKLRNAVSCELQSSSSVAARAVYLNPRRDVDDKQRRIQKNGDEFEQSCERPPIELKSDQELSKPKSVEAGISQQMPEKPTLSDLCEMEDEAIAPQPIVAAAERAVSRQATKTSLKAASSSEERCSSLLRSQSMDEAMLIEYARLGTLHLQKSAERMASHRYYQGLPSRERTSCWSSTDGNDHLGTIDLVGPSAARFLQDKGCVSPVKSPMKTPAAVPFKWEKEPGKPKDDGDSATSAQSRSTLQLPPRLAVGYQKQCSSPLRNRYINMSMSAPLAELYPLPSQNSSFLASYKVQIARVPTNFKNTAQNPCSSSSERGSRSSAELESPMTNPRSIGEVKSAPLTLSRDSVGGDVGDRGICRGPCSSNAVESRQPNEEKPAHLSGRVRPASPTSILCGPDCGSRPSSNPSLNSEHEAPQISATTAASPLFHSRSPSHASFDSIEHPIEHNIEHMSPESSLTSPLRAHSRCDSLSYNPDFDHMRKYLNSDYQEGAAHRDNAFIKFCKNGKRWMKIKSNSKLGTIYSPEIWTPSFRLQFQPDTNFDFSARLGESSSPLHLLPEIDHGHVQTESRPAPMVSALSHDDLGDLSPAYAASLELLSPVEKLSSKKKKNRQMKSLARAARNKIRRMQVRVQVRERFLVPIRRAFRTLFSRFTFRRRNKKVKAGDSKLLYHVDYTFSPVDFRHSKAN